MVLLMFNYNLACTGHSQFFFTSNFHFESKIRKGSDSYIANRTMISGNSVRVSGNPMIADSFRWFYCLRSLFKLVSVMRLLRAQAKLQYGEFDHT